MSNQNKTTIKVRMLFNIIIARHKNLNSAAFGNPKIIERL